MTVTLTVRDQLGRHGHSHGDRPPGQPHAGAHPRRAPAAARFAVGDPVALSATATDAEDGAAGRQLGHGPAALPVRRQLPPCTPTDTITGPTYSRAFTDHGADTTMLVTARVADSKGAAATDHVRGEAHAAHRRREQPGRRQPSTGSTRLGAGRGRLRACRSTRR